MYEQLKNRTSPYNIKRYTCQNHQDSTVQAGGRPHGFPSAPSMTWGIIIVKVTQTG